MGKTISWVVTAVALALALAGCGSGPGAGTGGAMPAPHVGEWHFSPTTRLTLSETTFTIQAGDGMSPLTPEPVFNQITKLAISGTFTVMDTTYVWNVDPDSLEVEFADAAQAAVLAPLVRAAIQAAAAEPATAEIDPMSDPPTMTVIAPLINPLLALPADARLKACKGMVCAAPNAMAWWNSLSAEQAAAALYGDMPTPEEAAAAAMSYRDLHAAVRMAVDLAAVQINGHVRYDSVGAWWESLVCREARIAAGDGNTTDPMSPYCRHYPGSDVGPEMILSQDALAQVDKVGMALLGRTDPGVYAASG